MRTADVDLIKRQIILALKGESTKKIAESYKISTKSVTMKISRYPEVIVGILELWNPVKLAKIKDGLKKSLNPNKIATDVDVNVIIVLSLKRHFKC